MADPQETINQLKKEQKAGRIRYYGVSNYGPKNMNEFLAAGATPVSNQVCKFIVRLEFLKDIQVPLKIE